MSTMQALWQLAAPEGAKWYFVCNHLRTNQFPPPDAVEWIEGGLIRFSLGDEKRERPR
jgi:hypothetical protein